MEGKMKTRGGAREMPELPAPSGWRARDFVVRSLFFCGRGREVVDPCVLMHRFSYPGQRSEIRCPLVCTWLGPDNDS
ncbi:hypothetical protein BV25DRAFT_1472476 [Artomyces pyxidatus]|uniref:Uncharacterized protein n=1 Tax=Artomyces pyxidatus TaxID=48021 RepID=A0ACB8SM31_9AGAM|nr:hypothetical protein BV25DRAFT_1472476 [Artomyces pyxidatus]